MTTPFELHKPNPLLIAISGPSGVGKDSIVQRMMIAADHLRVKQRKVNL
jgi:guanylate kinase